MIGPGFVNPAVTPTYTFSLSSIDPELANGSAITFAGKCRTPISSSSKEVIFSNDDGTANNYETLYRDANGDMIFEYRSDIQSIARQINGGNVGDDEDFSWAVLSDTNNFALVIDGWPPQTNFLGPRPILTNGIGRIGADLNGNSFQGTISEYEIF